MAVAKDFVKNSGMDVTLVIYESSSHPSHESASFRKKVLDLIHETQGSYTKYTKNGVYQAQ